MNIAVRPHQLPAHSVAFPTPPRTSSLRRTASRLPSRLAQAPRTTCRYANVLRLLDEAGAMRLGYTALTEIAYEPSGYNAVHGRVRNPWNLDFISGGSSSGSAAAVASGSVVVALGSDTGGSLRIPAHACGITAWKPAWGTVSTRGAMPLAPTLDTIGLLARGAADMMPTAEVLGDLRDETSVRSGVVLQDALEAAHPSVRELLSGRHRRDRCVWRLARPARRPRGDRCG